MTGYGSGRVGRDRFDSSPLDDDEDVERERIRRAELRDREADRRHDEEAIYGPRVIPQRTTESKAYIFNIKRCGKGNEKRYGNNEVDVFALVCLDTKMIGYIKTDDMPDTINYRVDSLAGSYYDEKGIQDFKVVSDLFSSGLSRRAISEKTGISYATVSRMLQSGYKPFKTEARYFSETQRSAEWFSQI